MNYSLDPILLMPPLSGGSHAPPITSDSQVIQSKYLPVIGNHPRRTPTSYQHNSLNIQPKSVLIQRLTDKFFRSPPLTLQPTSPTNRELHSIQPDQNTQTKTYEAYTAVISLPEVSVVCSISTAVICTYIYIHISQFHLYSSVNVYSNWL
jgi:hypothetical protein